MFGPKHPKHVRGTLERCSLISPSGLLLYVCLHVGLGTQALRGGVQAVWKLRTSTLGPTEMKLPGTWQVSGFLSGRISASKGCRVGTVHNSLDLVGIIKIAGPAGIEKKT